MKRLLIASVLSAVVAACGIVPVSPEQQIRDGANVVSGAATVTASLLTVDKITKAQAVSYRAILGSASSHLDTAYAILADCRKKTGSTQASNPDPCKPTVESDIALGVSIATDVRKTLDAKQ